MHRGMYQFALCVPASGRSLGIDVVVPFDQMTAGNSFSRPWCIIPLSDMTLPVPQPSTRTHIPRPLFWNQEFIHQGKSPIHQIQTKKSIVLVLPSALVSIQHYTPQSIRAVNDSEVAETSHFEILIADVHDKDSAYRHIPSPFKLGNRVYLQGGILSFHAGMGTYLLAGISIGIAAINQRSISRVTS